MPYKNKKKQKAAQARARRERNEYYNSKQKERFDKNRLFIIQYLKEHPCIACGEDDIIVLDFDHRRRSTKDRTINIAIKCFGIERLKREIKKCDILCANCHRRKTARQLKCYKLHKRFKNVVLDTKP